MELQEGPVTLHMQRIRLVTIVNFGFQKLLLHILDGVVPRTPSWILERCKGYATRIMPVAIDLLLLHHNHLGSKRGCGGRRR